MSGTIAEEQSLWECLHDGALDSLTLNALARTATVIVDVPYLWSFHSLSPDTRFRLVLTGVSSVAAMDFHAWPGEHLIPAGIPWKESEELRRQYFAKGSYHSLDWQSVAPHLERPGEFEITNARVTDLGNEGVNLNLDLMGDETGLYPQIVIKAEALEFFLSDDNELSQADFLELGHSYWEDWAKGSSTKIE
jgi:hypothetical protein